MSKKSIKSRIKYEAENYTAESQKCKQNVINL